MFIAVLGMNTVNAQIEKGAKIEFSKETHDYGNIKYGGEPYCNFEFKNTGDEPLIISNAINEPNKVIRIKGEVGPAPEVGTPVNNAGAPTNN